MAKDSVRNMTPLISVIVPVYNVEIYLVRCIESIIRQTYSNFELLLINDGSTDRSGVICDEYATKEPRIKVIHQTNQGLSHSRNYGINISNGKYLCFIDSDDYLENDYIEHLFRLISTSTHPIAACNVTVIRNDKVTTLSPVSETVVEMTAFTALRECLYNTSVFVSPTNKLFLRSLFSELKFPIVNRYEEIRFIPQIIDYADGVVYSFLPKYNYCIRESSITTTQSIDKQSEIIEAYSELAIFIKKTYPELTVAAVCSEAVSFVKLRKFFCNCPNKYRAARHIVEMEVRKRAIIVLLDKRAPIQAKIGVVIVGIMPFAYDTVWLIYKKLRGGI
jgi:glycosyltransferase involved in cell wall biosynthesis